MMKTYEERLQFILSARDARLEVRSRRQRAVRQYSTLAACFALLCFGGLTAYQGAARMPQIPIADPSSGEQEQTGHSTPAVTSAATTGTTTAGAKDEPIITSGDAPPVTSSTVTETNAPPVTTQQPDEDTQCPSTGTPAPWEEMPVEQQYFMCTYAGADYQTAQRMLSDDAVGEAIGTGWMSGWDFYTDTYFHLDAAVFAVIGTDPMDAVAVRFPAYDGYYLYTRCTGAAGQDALDESDITG